MLFELLHYTKLRINGVSLMTCFKIQQMTVRTYKLHTNRLSRTTWNINAKISQTKYFSETLVSGYARLFLVKEYVPQINFYP